MGDERGDEPQGARARLLERPHADVPSVEDRRRMDRGRHREQVDAPTSLRHCPDRLPETREGINIRVRNDEGRLPRTAHDPASTTASVITCMSNAVGVMTNVMGREGGSSARVPGRPECVERLLRRCGLEWGRAGQHRSVLPDDRGADMRAREQLAQSPGARAGDSSAAGNTSTISSARPLSRIRGAPLSASNS